MAETLPTSFLLASFWATVGAVFVRLKWRATYDQLSVLWLMSVFAFGLAGAPALFTFGWRAGFCFCLVAAVAPSIAYLFHMEGRSPERSEHWSILLYSGLLIAAATVVTLNARVFVEDLQRVSGLSVLFTTIVYLTAVLGIGLTGVVTALGLRKLASEGSDV